MKKLYYSLMAFCMISLYSVSAFADPEPYEEMGTALTDLVSDIIPTILLIFGSVLGLAAGVYLVKIGFTWIKRFIKG